MRATRGRAATGIRPRFKVWLSKGDTDGVFGGGKWRLLEAIDREGSLLAAAASLGISYRKAWGDLRKAERDLGVTFLERRRGGRDGGESRLTAAGKLWLKEYRRFHDKVERAVEQAFKVWAERIDA